MDMYLSKLIAIFTLVILFTVSALTYGQNKAFDLKRLDRSVSPCTDFFQFANGGWLDKTNIPKDRNRWSSGNILAENNRKILETIVEKAVNQSNAPRGSDSQLIGDIYFSCMDKTAIEKTGINPIKPYLNQIASIKDKNDLHSQIVRMHNMGVYPLFSFYVQGDEKNSNIVIANTFQGGLSLNNKDYYVGSSPRMKETRDEFRKYIVKLFRLTGDSEQEARNKMFTVMRIQTQLAYASFSRTELRIPENYYKKVSITEANKITPDFDWDKYMKLRGIKGVSEFNIGMPKYFKTVNQMLNDFSVEEWKSYLQWMLLDEMSSLLSSKFVDANFEFYGKFLNGVQQNQPREQICIRSVDNNVGESLGQLYVANAFNPKSKVRMNELIDNLIAAMRERIDRLEWMSEKTKIEALAKLSALKRKVGYPDKLMGYKGLDINRKSYFNNWFNAYRFRQKRRLDDIGKPIDRERFAISPPTVNAYYESQLNEIVFPAGILQPPYFNADADAAINYGAIGSVIGHEIVHGYDDFGSRFDSKGNLRMWWTEDDRKKFNERSSCLVEQFNSYEVLPNLFMNGRLTLGENIADFGGIQIAYDAFIKSMKGKLRPENIDGFTPEQRFFLGWAQVMAAKSTEEFQRRSVVNNNHPLSRWRVNGPLSNMPQFAQAFDCNESQAMVGKDMCEIW